jgi:hypothetical protein
MDQRGPDHEDPDVLGAVVQHLLSSHACRNSILDVIRRAEQVGLRTEDRPRIVRPLQETWNRHDVDGPNRAG